MMTETDLTETELAPPPVPTPYAAAVLAFLGEGGFRPHLDEEGDVAFKYQGVTYFVMTAYGDATSLAIVLPFFWPLEDAAERQRALEAAMQAQMLVRVGRIIVMDDNVNASINVYLPDDDSFKAVLLRSVDGLRVLCLKFREQMLAQLDN